MAHATDLGSFFADSEISKPAIDPHLTSTCGAVVMHPEERRMESVWGVPGSNEWEEFRF
jgi:hypothetical protein